MAPSIAIAHDYFTQLGGAERVALELAAAFPDAPIYTAVVDGDTTFAGLRGRTVMTSNLQRLPLMRSHHRLAFPLLAQAFGALAPDADVTVCSSSGWAHGVRQLGRKIVYCHTPARWIYDLSRYTGGRGSPGYIAGAALRPLLRQWDQEAARQADVYLANSTEVQGRIRRIYKRDAEVVFPPVLVEAAGDQLPLPGVDPGFFLTVARLLPYKNVEAVVDAFRDVDQRLVVIGGGPLLGRIRNQAPRNVHVAGPVPDAALRWAYANCRAVIAASWEDFGLVPVEAAAFGKPTLALRWGGHLDTVVPDTGLFFDAPVPGAIRSAVDRFDPADFDPAHLRSHAHTFSVERFVAAIREHVARLS